ncbi:CAT RNA binding domain-containing protein [Numidum massiliense]|nr:CAT RNA binding domain-containing protein [Numidum massiliense]
MKIKKVLNNSAVIVQDQQEEKIVLAPGVGF